MKTPALALTAPLALTKDLGSHTVHALSRSMNFSGLVVSAAVVGARYNFLSCF